ncbi:nucleoside hydrolase [Halorubrum sp. CBA1125]|uniref:nucleoside hydrolase n=1 Tax=Halorubrum sp. CBA1125 TaxID=2668072 RepID=UPI00135E4AE2|nr:nucleoside hydrolase [Halorubrum sp. CBA1125]MUW13442.1 nucleoside hydrolase [Halorubrum sp. CBA1125]
MTRKILFDTDPGCDDASALSLALASDELEVVGVTTVAGNTTIENTTRNALSVLELHDRTDVPVARGCAAPLWRPLETAEHVHGSSGITGSPPVPDVETIDTSGTRFMLEQVYEHGDELTIVAVGPLTNVATAIAIEPDLPELIDEIAIMGGAALCPGNSTPEAEFNFYVDPEAAQRVVRDGNPRLIGLDVTQDATLTAEFVEELAERDDPHRTLAAWFGYSEVDAIREGELSGEQVVHDVTVIIDLIDDILEYRRFPVNVGTDDGDFRGAVVCDVNDVTGTPPTANVALEVNVPAFRNRIAELIEKL